LARGRAPVASPVAAFAACQGDRAPTPTGRGCAPCTRIRAAMSKPQRIDKEPAPASEAPEVIHLPDRRQHGRKKITSGSQKRRRRHLERFATDDAEHAALHEMLRASGKSLGAFVMEVAGIAAGQEARPRMTRRRVRADVSAFLQGVVEFRRANGLLNQQTRAVNTTMLFAEEHGAARLADEVRAWRRSIDLMREQNAATHAAMIAALDDEREG